MSNPETNNRDRLALPDALAISPNTAFVQLELDTGIPDVLNMAYRLGLRNTLEHNVYGAEPTKADPSQMMVFQNRASFTLGTAALSPLELANVMATLGSGGVWCPPTPILSVTDRYGKQIPFQQPPCEQVVPAGLANTELNGLSHDTVPGEGTSYQPAQAANWTLPLAGKTGTTQQAESLAFVGLTGNLAASSIFFADGSRPANICGDSNTPYISSSCAGGFGGPIAAPTYFQAFQQIYANQTPPGIPGPDPAYMDAGDRGPTVPFVMRMRQTAAVDALRAAGYHATILPYNSTQPKGTVMAQTPQGNQVPTGQAITLWVSTGAQPAPQASSAPPSVAPGATSGG